MTLVNGLAQPGAAWRFALAILVTLVGGSTAMAASFNCKPYVKSGKCPEAAICQNADLSLADDTMTALYAQVLAAIPKAGRNGFRAGHREALKERDACGCDHGCLSAWHAATNKSYVEQTAVTSGPCPKGEIMIDGQCMPPEDAEGFCGPGYRPEGGTCVQGYKAPQDGAKLPSWQIEAIRKGCAQGMAWSKAEGCHEND